MEKNKKEIFIEIEGRRIPARIWIGNLFDCSNSLIYFSIFVIPAIISLTIGLTNGSWSSTALGIFWGLVNICGVISWIYGINDLSKLRKKGFIEINISLFSLNISFIIFLIFQIYRWELDNDPYFVLFLTLLLIFFNNYVLFKIYKGWKKNKHLFTCSNSQWIPYPALLAIFLYLYLGITFLKILKPDELFF